MLLKRARDRLANILTVSRICFSLCLLAVKPFSYAFWLLYTICGMSDMLDGYLARKLGQESRAGAILDSVADAIFVAACLTIVLAEMSIPKGFILCGVIIASIKLATIIAVFCTQRGAAPLHSLANKAVGCLLFLSPLLYAALGLIPSGILLALSASLAALYELIRLISKRARSKRATDSKNNESFP